MSAIWGVIQLKEPKCHRDLHTVFQTVYSEKCHVDRYTHYEDDRVYMGCGIQQIRTYLATASHVNTSHATTSHADTSLATTSQADTSYADTSYADTSLYKVSPLADTEKGLFFAADCLLDNREEIYSLLSSRSSHSSKEFSSRCATGSLPDLEQLTDDELMYLAYQYLGEDCFSYFTGLYSVAIWDDHTECLTLVTDPVSSRCLYYTNTGDSIGFSTLLDPLVRYLELVTRVKPLPNESYFKDFLLADPSLIYVYPGETPYQNIWQIPPSTILKIKAGKITATTYEHNFKHNHEHTPEPSNIDWGKAFMELYSECVADAIRTSGEVGIALSSGLDSSSIAVLAAQMLADDKKDLYSFTFSPYLVTSGTTSKDSNAIFNESELIRELCASYPTIKPTFLTNEGKNCFQDVPECLSILEMPYKSGAIPNHLEIAKHASALGCRILLNGAYGNSTVSYGELLHILYDLYLGKNLDGLVSNLNQYCAHQGMDPEKALKDCLALFYNYSPKEFRADQFIPENPFLLPAILKDYNLSERFCADPRTLGRQLMDHSCYPTYLQSPALLMYLGAYETKMGLAMNMVLRDPTKDIRIIQFCKQLPYFMFAQNGETRWLIRHNFRNLLPSSFLKNRQQHAYLNADWLDRVQRDWEQLRPHLLELLQSVPLPEYLATDRLIQYISHMDFKDKHARNAFKYVCAIINTLLFDNS